MNCFDPGGIADNTDCYVNAVILSMSILGLLVSFIKI